MAKNSHITPMVKVGDKIVEYARSYDGGKTRKPLRIVTVERMTPTLAICGYGRRTVRWSVRGLVPATPEELAAAQAHFDAERKAESEAKAQQSARDADPHYQLVRRFKDGDFEPWGKLTLEQLQAVAAMLDAVTEPKGE